MFKCVCLRKIEDKGVKEDKGDKDDRRCHKNPFAVKNYESKELLSLTSQRPSGRDNFFIFFNFC